MSFLTSLALLVGLFVAAPIAAHLLRRKRAAEVDLPTASLLTATPPTARRRSALEDRALLGVRALAVLLLAALGATPFVRCSHVALVRRDGASVAMVIVLDDSLSMRVKADGDQTRFDVAKKAAEDLVAAAEPGDSYAIVLAGGEARVHLAATMDARAARAALEDVSVSDRPTDLTSAIALAKDVLKGAPQPDKRIVLLSDLADGDPQGPALDAGEDVTLWYPLPDLEAKKEGDCAIVGTERKEASVEVALRCTPGAGGGRAVRIVDAGKPSEVLASVDVPSPAPEVISLKIDGDAPAELDATLTGSDAIAADDVAPVAHRAKQATIGALVDAAASRVQTGGPPSVERALSALDLGSLARPLSSIPEHEEELSGFAGLILDDPPGLTPEERTTVATWVESGGVLLLSLGRRAAAAPLGAGFGALVPGVVRFAASASKSGAPKTCAFFGASADSLSDVAPSGRAQVAADATKDTEVLCAFDDGAPLLFKRQLGKGAVLVSTLPFDFETSDLALRPAFFVLLDRFVTIARTGGGAKAVETGQRFAFVGAKSVQGELLSLGEKRPTKLDVPVSTSPRVDAARIGRYHFVIDGAAETRIAFAPAKEIDLAPRALSPRARDPSLGGEARQIDASPYVALALLALMLVEIVLRLFWPSSPAPERAAPDGAAS